MSTYFMLIDVIEPILDNVKLNTSLTNAAKQTIKQLMSHLKTIKIKNVTTEITRISLREQIPKCSMLTTSDFVPEHILEYIEKESKVYTTHQYVYKERQFKIIMVFDDANVERKKGIVEDMFKWLTMIVDMSKLPANCAQTTTIYCYLTPFKKTLPPKSGEFLSYDNANSAVTTSCSASNEICIFREEELFKVFIHETFHAFNLDFSLHMRDSHVLKMKQLYHIKSDFNIYETYAETWAEIMNIVFLSGDVSVVNKMLQAEVAFSLHQMNKVLAYMGLDYADLVNGVAYVKYKEETNVFCYYVLKTVMLFYASDFIEFCGGSFKFHGDIGAFIDFVGEKYKQSEFMNAAEISAEHVVGTSMRMSLWEN